jgi:hypothetical protein
METIKVEQNKPYCLSDENMTKYDKKLLEFVDKNDNSIKLKPSCFGRGRDFHVTFKVL